MRYSFVPSNLHDFVRFPRFRYASLQNSRHCESQSTVTEVSKQEHGSNQTSSNDAPASVPSVTSTPPNIGVTIGSRGNQGNDEIDKIKGRIFFTYHLERTEEFVGQRRHIDV